MPSTYTPIATQTLGSAASSVTFSSIPSTYTDLILIVSGTGSTDTNLNTTFNSDTSTNYSRTFMFGNGSSATSGRESSQNYMSLTYLTTGQTNSIYQIMNYSNTTTNKTVLSRTNASAVAVTAIVCLWRSTAAVSTITLTAGSGNIQAGSTFTLYGVKSA